MGRELPILFNTDMVCSILDGRKGATRRIIKFPVNHFTNERPKAQHVKVYGNTLYGKTVHFYEEPFYSFYINPPYRTGDILYVREAWHKDVRRYMYRADYDDNEKFYRNGKEVLIKWHPSIHMPKEAARIWVKVTDVWVEQLQDITEAQAIKEGVIRLYDDMPDTEYLDWTKRTDIYPKAKEEWKYKNYLWHGNFGMHGMGNKMSDAWKYQYSSYDSARDSFSSLWNTTVSLKDWNVYGWDANPWVWVIEFERCEKPAAGEE